MRYQFANCVLDEANYRFIRADEEIALEPQVFDLLRLLAQNAGTLLSRETLISEIWGGRIISEATISTRINAARKAVGDTGKAQAIIRTVPRRGLMLVAPVTHNAAPAETAMVGRQKVRFIRSADGTQLAYAVSGNGPPILRAGHFLTHLEMDWQNPVWRPYLDALSRHHTLVRYDQRGTGLSDPDLGEMGVAAYAADLMAVADATGMKQFPIVASSQGVPVAVHAATQHPERISRLVLYGGFARGRARRDHDYAQAEAESLLTMIRAGWGDPESAFMAAFTSVFCPGATKEERDEFVRMQIASASPDNAARIRVALDGFDVSAELPQVRAPTLVIHASHDGLHPLSEGREVAAGIPGAEFVQVNSHNHIPLPSDPAWHTIVEATLDFLDRA